MTRLIDADKLPFHECADSDCIEASKENCAVCEFRCVTKEEIDNAPTVDITEEQAIDKLHETGWLPMHDKEMTERPQGKLNEAIKTIKAVCSMQKACIECPMNSNCNEFPQEWKETERGAE